MNKLYSVCWNITSLCNESCKFCFRDITKDLTLDENMKILKKLIKYGIKKITFTGGEAPLYKDLFVLIKHAKNEGIVVQLITNAKVINYNFYSEICKYIDWISLPLDAVTQKTQSLMSRNENHIENVTEILNNIKKLELPVKVKINTVVSKINMDEIPLILNYIESYNVSKWKLFQFSPIRYNAEANKDLYHISDEQYEKLIRHILDKYEGKIDIIPQRTNDFCNSYFVISSNGNVLMGDTNESVGNLLYHSIDDISDKLGFNYDDHYKRRSEVS
jgi:MoaA/NifB/PqqE/SkfB family radical SAM enzyme